MRQGADGSFAKNKLDKLLKRFLIKAVLVI